MNKRFVLMMLVAAAALSAQEATSGSTPPPTVVHLVHLKYVDANNVGVLFSYSGVAIKSDNVLNSIVLKGEPKTVEEVEQLIRELDVPGTARAAQQPKPNLEFQVYVVAGGDEVAADPLLPKALEPAIAQLRSMFPFRGYRLLETIQSRVVAGGNISSSGTLGRLESGPGANVPTYSLNIATDQMLSPSNPVDLRFKFEASSIRPAMAENGVTVPERQIRSFMETHFSVNPGQLVVVGKSGYGDTSLFLIVSAKVAN